MALNNKAVDAATDRKNEHSLLFLSQAKRSMGTKRRVRPASPSATLSPDTSYGFTLEASCPILYNSDYVGHQSCEPYFEFFNRMFYIVDYNEGRSLTKTSRGEDSIAVSAVALYNKAITHHLLYLKSGSTQQDWKEALLSYKECFQLLSSIEFSMSTFGLLFLAMFNNVGHLHTLVLNRKKAISNRDVMEKYLQLILQAGDNLVAEHYRFFETTLLLSKERGPCAAASA